jgi:RecA/RadA recombinase
MIYDEQLLTLMLIHLVRREPILERMVSILEPEDFNSTTEKPAKLIWAVARDWYLRNKRSIPVDFMQAELTTRIGEARSMFSDDDIDRIIHMVKVIYTAPPDVFVDSEILNIIQEFIDERRFKPQLAAIPATQDDFGKALTELMDNYYATRVHRGEAHADVFLPDTIAFRDEVRHLTGVEMIDTLMSDGLSSGIMGGELCGILGPTGGGKTTLGTMMVAEMAKQEKYAAFISYETELVPQITNRLYSYLGNIPRGVLRQVRRRDDLPIQYLKPLQDVLARYGKYICACDMKKNLMKGVGAGGAMELRNKLRWYADQGKPITLVVIDQLLPMVDSYMLSRQLDIRERRAHIMTTIEQLRDITQPNDCNCTIVILHQVDNRVKRAKPERRPQKGDAAEDKSFENNMHFCFNLGTHDPNGRMWLASTKTRDASENAIIIEMDKDIARLNYQEGRFACGPAGFYERSGSVSAGDTVIDTAAARPTMPYKITDKDF